MSDTDEGPQPASSGKPKSAAHPMESTKRPLEVFLA
jgi:hypothetical protein